MKNMRFSRLLVLASFALAAVARPSQAQTFLQQIFPNNPPVFEVSVEESSLLTFTVMWNRQDTDLVLAMVCEGTTEPIDWGISFPLQDRTLRFDAGVLDDRTCTVALASAKVAAFALNVQQYDQGNLSNAATVQMRPVSVEKRAEPKMAAMIRRLEEILGKLVK